ncbi:hypothetical protein H6G41_21030 [Tolypothrix sp. FACHB-123]|uniref:hypothetical protein n=1 Tax=Tolypothrix sp. FACHB-123 TaxID=2692868 RepID=UPI001688A1ED|nr:hypothetical protein [Tolypothrix sp. FACHB-123]MBD2357079.1 hypothetical protein [Tolypothrix sp. FACHB-123]
MARSTVNRQQSTVNSQQSTVNRQQPKPIFFTTVLGCYMSENAYKQLRFAYRHNG